MVFGVCNMYVEERVSTWNPPYEARNAKALSPMRLMAPWPVEEIRNKF